MGKFLAYWSLTCSSLLILKSLFVISFSTMKCQFHQHPKIFRVHKVQNKAMLAKLCKGRLFSPQIYILWVKFWHTGHWPAPACSYQKVCLKSILVPWNINSISIQRVFRVHKLKNEAMFAKVGYFPLKFLYFGQSFVIQAIDLLQPAHIKKISLKSISVP